MPLGKLVEQILGITAKNPKRIRQILLGGSLVAGSTRYRWQPVEVLESELHSLLQEFPDSEPERTFQTAKCRRVTFKGRRGTLELTQQVASERRLFRKQSFWEILVPLLEARSPSYLRYSYADRADLYEVFLSPANIACLQSHVKLLRYPSIVKQFECLGIDGVEILAER